MTMPPMLINPVVQWAVEPGHVGSVRYIDNAFGRATVPPEVGQLLTLPFMVDPVTGLPCPVRVTRIEYLWDRDHHVVAPVVVRATQD